MPQVITAPGVKTKKPGESILYAMDFRKRLGSGETLSTPTIAASPSTGITLGAASISGTQVRCRISSGTDGQTYTLTWGATASGGNILQNDSQLQIRSTDSPS